MRETDPKNTELMLWREYIPTGESERHMSHQLDVFVKPGKQPCLFVFLELCCCAVKRKIEIEDANRETP